MLMAALVALSVAATSVAASGTVIDLANFPSPARLVVEGGAAQDQAGAAVAAGDLNGDGVADLVIGARYADPGGRTNAGEVYAIYGGGGASGTLFLGSSFTGVRWRGSAALDQFGEALATGDFNGDNLDDLAVGASWAAPGGRVDAGTVYVIFGQPGPLPSLDLSSQSAPLTLWGAAGDRAGLAVAFGDLDGNGRDELIIGAPRAGAGGRVYILPGSSTLSGIVDLAAAAGVVPIEAALASSEFGGALAAADVDADGKADLLIGAPYASPNGRSGAGAAYLLPGRSPLAPVNLAAQPASLTVIGALAGDNLGAAVALGDLTSDGKRDLVLGAPTATRAGQTSAGAAYGLAWRADLPPTLDLAAVTPELLLEGATSYDKLGAAVGAVDLNGDTRSDLLAGVPNGDAPGRPQSGLLLGLQGQQAGPNLPDLTIYGAFAGDRTGAALAGADVTGDGHPDLILGAPRADSFAGMDAGRVYVLAGPPPPPTLSAQVVGAEIRLSWLSDPGFVSYEVLYSLHPYFNASDPDVTKATASGTTWTHAGAAHNVANNYCYSLRGAATSGLLSSLSNRQCEFTFGLVAGG